MKYVVETLGCKVNTYESEALKQLLDLEGYQQAKEDDYADVVVVNTCSVTSVSDQKSRQKIRSLIRKYPHTIMVVMGCYSQISADEVKKIPGVSIVLGTNSRHLIPSLIKRYLLEKQQICLIDSSREQSYENLTVTSYYENTRAFLKIQDGCNNFCSYCIIPYARGKMRSRPKEEVLKEVNELLNHGFKEIVLTGIHTAGYGKDLINYSFTDLIKDIIKDPRLKRLRISSIEESEITQELIDLIADNACLAKHLHIPLQSGSDEVLKRMNRKYLTSDFLRTINRLREKIPNISITTDIIVGFPQESEIEFQKTLAFAKLCQFAKIHVFPFSSRQGTPASKMSGQVSNEIKKARVRELLSLSNKLENEYQNKFIGKQVDVIFEEYDQNTHRYKGHSSNYLLVYSEETDENLHNVMQNVKYVKI